MRSATINAMCRVGMFVFPPCCRCERGERARRRRAFKRCPAHARTAHSRSPRRRRRAFGERQDSHERDDPSVRISIGRMASRMRQIRTARLLTSAGRCISSIIAATRRCISRQPIAGTYPFGLDGQQPEKQSFRRQLAAGFALSTFDGTLRRGIRTRTSGRRSAIRSSTRRGRMRPIRASNPVAFQGASLAVAAGKGVTLLFDDMDRFEKPNILIVRPLYAAHRAGARSGECAPCRRPQK